ncbi:MAG: RloB domain-containing protein [Bacteroidales bacterium]|nr:RloB domain-containing protein [Bacteroidales bacterium]
MPGRLRVKNTFGERLVESYSKETKSVYLISIAGEGKTEELYFDGIHDMVSSNIIKIERLEKHDKTDTKSHPNYVIELLDERKAQWEEHGLMPDELWMVVDRDKQNVTSDQLFSIIEKCKSEGFNLALSNPTFEFWLLLHITDIDSYDHSTLLANPKPRAKSKKRYVESEISKLISGYNKNSLRFDKFEMGIKNAIIRAQKLPTDNIELINSLGTSVCLLVEKLIK